MGRRWRGGPWLLALVVWGTAMVPAWAGPLKFLKLPSKAPPAGPSAPPVPGSMPEADFQRLLLEGDLAALNQACQEAVGFDFVTRLRLLRKRLLEVALAPQSLEVVLTNANALLSCRAADDALVVLDRISPPPGPGQDQWLIQRWRAAHGALNHRLAAEALGQLARGLPGSLETVALPVAVRQDGTVITRAALDVQADHLEALGRRQEAAAVLLAGRMPGKPAAERLARAVALLDGLPPAQRNPLMETALEQAAAAGAWGLAVDLLNQQRALLLASGDSDARPSARLRTLARRIDDAYAEWQLTRQDPLQGAREAELRRQLRSPLGPGGHALRPQSPGPPRSDAAPAVMQPQIQPQSQPQFKSQPQQPPAPAVSQPQP